MKILSLRATGYFKMEKMVKNSLNGCEKLWRENLMVKLAKIELLRWFLNVFNINICTSIKL